MISLEEDYVNFPVWPVSGQRRGRSLGLSCDFLVVLSVMEVKQDVSEETSQCLIPALHLGDQEGTRKSCETPLLPTGGARMTNMRNVFRKADPETIHFGVKNSILFHKRHAVSGNFESW